MKKINSNELLENYIKVKTIKNPEKSINTHINELLGNTNNQIMQTSLQQIIPNQIQQIPQQQVVQIQQQIPIENNLDKISINKPKLVHFETQSEVDSSANSLLIRFRELESNLNKCLIKEDLQKSKNIYLEMKYIFTKFPDTYYETKTDLFSDVLSANFRIHKLEEIMNDLQKQELNRMLIDQERKDVIIKEKEKIKSEKEQLEEQINNMQDDIVKFSFKKNDEYDIEPDTIITGNDLNTIKEKARLERLIHDKEILSNKNNKPKLNFKKQPERINLIRTKPQIKNEPEKKQPERINLTKNNQQIKNKPEKKQPERINLTKNNQQIKNEPEKKQIHIKKDKKIIKPNNLKKPKSKDEIINYLYLEGLKKVYSDKNKAKEYFEKVLDINPFHKPSLIRLEQIN